MSYYIYKCEKDGHRHCIETDVRARKVLTCQFCKGELVETIIDSAPLKEEEEAS